MGVIINVRGSYGAGKSTLVRRVISEAYQTPKPYFLSGRRKPIGYLAQPKEGQNRNALWIVGHYESPCGGADTISKLDQVFEEVRKAAAQGYDVLYEGTALLLYEVKRTVELSRVDGLDLHVVVILVPLQLALDSIAERRAKQDREFKPVNQDNIKSKVDQARKVIPRLQSSKVSVMGYGREEAYQCVLRLLSKD